MYCNLISHFFFRDLKIKFKIFCRLCNGRVRLSEHITNFFVNQNYCFETVLSVSLKSLNFVSCIFLLPQN